LGLENPQSQFSVRDATHDHLASKFNYMATRFSILALLCITMYAALLFAGLTQPTPLRRLFAVYSLVVFTPGIFLPLIARGFYRRP
jgi:hypothetical protein